MRVAACIIVQPSPHQAAALASPGTLLSGSGRISAAREPDDPRLVAIGGGTGLPAVLEGLCGRSTGHPPVDPDDVTAIVTVTDDGGSSGRLRSQFGVLPPGDVRNCIAAAARVDSPFRELLQHRFSDGGDLEGHAVGNLLLTALTQMTGNFPAAVEKLGEMVGLRACVLPSTHENVRLSAEMESGRIVVGETAIANAGERIRHLSLLPNPQPLPAVLRALVNADGIVVGPGSLYTSILPVLLVRGIAATISGVDAVRIYVANLMTEPGETDDYTLGDHLDAIRTHTGFDLFDYVLVNRRPIDPAIVARYAEHGARPVTAEASFGTGCRARIIECDLAAEYRGEKIRHAPSSLARAIRTLVGRGRT
jgi:uncharacterized cofD-like protein